jgi:diguanylate cyclase (GGDEF)-like protein
MWRYLVLNALWFTILFTVHFFGTPRSRRFVFFSMWVAAGFLLTMGSVDPFAWTAYLLFSLVTYATAAQFNRWAFGRVVALDEELGVAGRRAAVAAEALAKKTQENAVTGRHADEILHLCDKMKEMSQSMDRLEVFLVFSEALSADFRFDCVKFVHFSDQATTPGTPEAVYQLFYSDLNPLFDRSLYLKERKRASGEVFGFDRMVIEAVLKKEKPLYFTERGEARSDEAFRLLPVGSPFLAHPIVIDKKVTGVLLVLGVKTKDIPIFSILTEACAEEMKRVRLYEKVQALAVTDGLTGVAVRRHLSERFEEEVVRSKRHAHKLSFLMIDIDHFKSFNDRYGHLVGDAVLREVAETIKKNIREVDLVGRYGGEEFGVFLTETDESGAFFVAERIRRAISDRAYRAYDEELNVTVSIGCATMSGAFDSALKVVEAADAALYQAKRQGRNRVHLSQID